MEINLQHLRRRRVALIGFDSTEADLISRSFASADAIAAVVTPGPGIPGVNRFAYHDVCVLNCTTQGAAGSPSDQIIRSHQPLLLIGEVEAVVEMLPVFVSVAKDFVARPYRQEELLLRADQLIAGTEQDMGAARASAQRSVLIAEDEEVTNALIATILKFAGFECASAIDGMQALEMVKQKKPDVVLLDVAMPRLNGFDALVALRRQPETHDLPVIMVTGGKSEEDIVRGFQLGADDYIVKPFNARELVVRVDRAVRKAESRVLSGMPEPL